MTAELVRLQSAYGEACTSVSDASRAGVGCVSVGASGGPAAVQVLGGELDSVVASLAVATLADAGGDGGNAFGVGDTDFGEIGKPSVWDEALSLEPLEELKLATLVSPQPGVLRCGMCGGESWARSRCMDGVCGECNNEAPLHATVVATNLGGGLAAARLPLERPPDPDPPPGEEVVVSARPTKLPKLQQHAA
jgi:hypothetical protein